MMLWIDLNQSVYTDPSAANDRQAMAPSNTAQKNIKASQRCARCTSLRGQAIGLGMGKEVGTNPSISA